MKTRREVDHELVESAQLGEVRAFETLMRRYQIRLTRYLLPFLRDGADTDDVVQETFIKAYLALNSFQRGSSFSTWLFRIGINTAKDTMAARGRQLPQLSVPEGEERAGDEHFDTVANLDTPEAQMETREILAVLDAALDALPEEQRTSLELRELGGLTYDEIALQMHCPVGTVRSRIHRARDTLAAALKAH